MNAIFDEKGFSILWIATFVFVYYDLILLAYLFFFLIGITYVLFCKISYIKTGVYNLEDSALLLHEKNSKISSIMYIPNDHIFGNQFNISSLRDICNIIFKSYIGSWYFHIGDDEEIKRAFHNCFFNIFGKLMLTWDRRKFTQFIGTTLIYNVSCHFRLYSLILSKGDTKDYAFDIIHEAESSLYSFSKNNIFYSPSLLAKNQKDFFTVISQLFSHRLLSYSVTRCRILRFFFQSICANIALSSFEHISDPHYLNMKLINLLYVKKVTLDDLHTFIMKCVNKSDIYAFMIFLQKYIVAKSSHDVEWMNGKDEYPYLVNLSNKCSLHMKNIAFNQVNFQLEDSEYKRTLKIIIEDSSLNRKFSSILDNKMDFTSNLDYLDSKGDGIYLKLFIMIKQYKEYNSYYYEYNYTNIKSARGYRLKTFKMANSIVSLLKDYPRLINFNNIDMLKYIKNIKNHNLNIGLFNDLESKCIVYFVDFNHLQTFVNSFKDVSLISEDEHYPVKVLLDCVTEILDFKHKGANSTFGNKMFSLVEFTVKNVFHDRFNRSILNFVNEASRFDKHIDNIKRMIYPYEISNNEKYSYLSKSHARFLTRYLVMQHFPEELKKYCADANIYIACDKVVTILQYPSMNQRFLINGICELIFTMFSDSKSAQLIANQFKIISNTK
ncbi:hypothetical protein A3Q56_03253 [Intoshia linei]|uniref:PXA domain-containing protein n=1 Tax=Intoshia linei TaxID=1819745 RepID=A0A177B453_9BILA|nr:hypothetical protein A3Q56_03253 [Intoshia linei]